MKQLLTVSALCVVFAACGASEPTGTTLVLAVQPTSTAEQLTSGAQAIEAFLEERLPNVDVEIRIPTMYAGTIEALRFGHAQAAFMSAWPAALARTHANADVALAEIREVVVDREAVERPFYFSHWVVLPGSEVQSLADLKGKRVAFSSQLSTSGFVMPMAKLVEEGLITPGTGEADPRTFFGEVLFAGGYAQAWEALKTGQVDATVIAGDVPATLYHTVLDSTRIIETQGPIPSHAVVFGESLVEPLRSQLRDALMALGAPEHRDLMRRFISGIFVRFEPTTTEAHLASLQSALDLTRLSYMERLR